MERRSGRKNRDGEEGEDNKKRKLGDGGENTKGKQRWEGKGLSEENALSMTQVCGIHPSRPRHSTFADVLRDLSPTDALKAWRCKALAQWDGLTAFTRCPCWRGPQKRTQTLFKDHYKQLL